VCDHATPLTATSPTATATAAPAASCLSRASLTGSVTRPSRSRSARIIKGTAAASTNRSRCDGRRSARVDGRADHAKTRPLVGRRESRTKRRAGARARDRTWPRISRTADPALAGARREISVSFLCAHGLYTPDDPNLAAQRFPVKTQRHAGIGLHLAALAAAEIGVENEPRLIETLKQHHAHRGQAVAIGGRERDSVGVVGFALLSFGKPLAKLAEGIGWFALSHRFYVQIAAPQLRAATDAVSPQTMAARFVGL
jgi:hypothetical protein